MALTNHERVGKAMDHFNLVIIETGSAELPYIQKVKHNGHVRNTCYNF
jgi:hypothetical protein